MATPSPRILLTDRDYDLLEALDRCPLTIEQLHKASVTFRQSFQSEPRVRGRLAALRQAGIVRRWQYATANRGGAPDYYRLSLAGYRLLHGPEAEAPTKRAFAEVGLAHQHHTRRLADFLTHTLVAAHARGLPLVDFCRENSLRLQVGPESLLPDCAFALQMPEQQLHFFVELDNGTERIRSQKDVDSWERKIRLYDTYQDGLAYRCRVLVVTTRSRERLDRVLAAAAALVRNPQRAHFYGVHLDDYLAQADAVGSPCFRDHRGEKTSLLPTQLLPAREALPSRVPAAVGSPPADMLASLVHIC